MVQVIACPKCGLAKICAEGVATTRCSHCSTSIHADRATVYYSGGDREMAMDAVFKINARSGAFPAAGRQKKNGDGKGVPKPTVNRPQRSRSLDSFLSARKAFSGEEFATWMELGADRTERLIAKLLESGRITAHRDGHYEIVR